MKKQLGCLSISGITAAIITTIVVIGFIFVGGSAIFSPGSLNAQTGDRQLGGISAHIDLSQRCNACHAPLWGRETMSDRCLACHTEVAMELQSPASLHGALMAGASLSCRDCHTEHKGASAPLTVIDAQRFPHDEATRYSLRAHQEMPDGDPFACADCHQQSLGRFDPNTCDTCHRDLDAAFIQSHVETFAQNCLACHDGVDTYGAAFDHNQVIFPLAGKHISVACIGCHEGARTASDLQFTLQTCYACHQQDDAHNAELGQDCVQCHTPNDWAETTFDHSLAGFPLTGAHSKVDCATCHLDNVFAGASQECYACHQQDDVHDGELGPDCIRCHTTGNWQQANFNHLLTDFPLTGAHLEVECAACHLNRQFKGIPRDCYGCHATDDEHNGQFGPECGTCHITAAWEQITIEDHIFPITHKNHGQPWACSACHPISLRTYACYDGCHEHTPARIERKHLKEGIDDFQNCVECHPTGREHEGERGDDD